MCALDVVFSDFVSNLRFMFQLLRTCSEPDLSKLFKTNIPENPFLFSGAHSLDADASDRMVNCKRFGK